MFANTVVQQDAASVLKEAAGLKSNHHKLVARE